MQHRSPHFPPPTTVSFILLETKIIHGSNHQHQPRDHIVTQSQVTNLDLPSRPQPKIRDCEPARTAKAKNEEPSLHLPASLVCAYAMQRPRVVMGRARVSGLLAYPTFIEKRLSTWMRMLRLFCLFGFALYSGLRVSFSHRPMAGLGWLDACVQIGREAERQAGRQATCLY
jgi:hypothetical protein